MIPQSLRLGLLAAAVALGSCSEPTGLPRAVRTPGTFAASFFGADLTGSAMHDYDASLGEVIRLTQTGGFSRIEIAVGPSPDLPTVSIDEPRDIPPDYVRFIRFTVGGDAPIIRTYQIVRGSYDGRISAEGTRIQMDVRLRLLEFGLDQSTQPEVRLRASAWAALTGL